MRLHTAIVLLLATASMLLAGCGNGGDSNGGGGGGYSEPASPPAVQVAGPGQAACPAPATSLDAMDGQGCQPESSP